MIIVYYLHKLSLQFTTLLNVMWSNLTKLQ